MLSVQKGCVDALIGAEKYKTYRIYRKPLLCSAGANGASPTGAAARSRMRFGPPPLSFETRVTSLFPSSRPRYRTGWFTNIEVSTVQ